MSSISSAADVEEFLEYDAKMSPVAELYDLEL
jgi:hypothetical protein